MSQQPAFAGRGGRGGGRGQQQPPQQQFPAPYATVAAGGGNSAPRQQSAWQPTSMPPQNRPVPQQPQAYQPHHHGQAAIPGVAGQPPMVVPGVVPVAAGAGVAGGGAPVRAAAGGHAAAHHMQQMQHQPQQFAAFNPGHYNTYAQYNQAAYYQQPGVRGMAPPQQPVYYNPNMQQQQPRQVYYPSQQTAPMPVPGSAGASIPSATNTVPDFQPLAPRPKKLPVITDRDGNVIDFSSMKKPTKTLVAPVTAPSSAAASTSAAAAAVPVVVAPAPASDFGAKMRQVAQERLAAKPTEPKVEETKAAAPVAENATPLAVKAAPASAPPPVATLADRMANIKLDDAPAKTTIPTSKGRVIYTKDQLLSFKSQFTARPESLPDLTIVKVPVTGGQRGGGGRGGGGGGSGGGGRHDRGGGDAGIQKGGGGGGDWSRGSAPPRRDSTNAGQSNGKEPNQWSRGHAPPPQQQQQQQQQNNRQSGRGGKQYDSGPFFDGPVAPLVKSENHWRPKKSTSALDIAEKQVMSVLNKMTKEKFAKLSEVMVQIPVTSKEILTMMIDRVYDKAIDEPAFGDMYSDLCFKLSHSAKVDDFVHIIESDEEPPTEGDATWDRGDSTSNTVYRWSNDVSTGDNEIVGPFDSIDACWEVALSEVEATPSPRDENMELELVEVAIRRGIFVKIMKKKDSDDSVFYTVYFPVNEANECGQQLSEIFLSRVECESDANKKNHFKNSLLNKCEEEFSKEDIYADWKKEKAAYEEHKASMTDAERAEKEEAFKFRRMRIKKQMLGNVKFIGQLYKKRLLTKKIMRFCITKLLKIDETKDPTTSIITYTDNGSVDMDEEDHEALCNIFTTIGSTIDTPTQADFVDVCFAKIKALSESKDLSSRSRFMYKDLLELRSNRWVPRRKEEKAKTLEEIRKDVEREERAQAQLSAQAGGRGNYGGGGRGSGGRGSNDRRASLNIRPRPKAVLETDDDGFTKTVSNKSTAKFQPKSIQSRPNGAAAALPVPTTKRSSFAALASAEESGHDSGATKSSPGPLDDDQLARRIKSMPMDFVNDNGNVDELLLSFDEISGTPDAARTLVSKSMDRLFECKDDERSAIIQILVILYEKKKLSKSDVQDGLADSIEFIDSIVVDAPKAFTYLGDVLSEMLRLKAVDFAWVCQQLEKCKDADANTLAAERTIKETLLSFKIKGGSDAAKALSRSSESILAACLGSDAALEAIVRSL
ncbi:hypothetical protein MPSEU_000548000 [Mayamaea pseudoterrestris]|nr:hypothetical protein MPSEU_000548000 [Mayamaea pseudoterrestris]